MIKRKFLFNTLAVLVLVVIFSPFVVSNVFAEYGSTNLTPTVKPTLNNPMGNIDLKQLFVNVMDNIVIKIGTIIAILSLIYSGYLFVEAQGNEGKLGKAKEFFYGTIIGITILLGAKAIAMIVAKTIESVSGANIF